MSIPPPAAGPSVPPIEENTAAAPSLPGWRAAATFRAMQGDTNDHRSARPRAGRARVSDAHAHEDEAQTPSPTHGCCAGWWATWARTSCRWPSRWSCCSPRAALELAGPYLTKVALDRALPERDAGLLGTLVALYMGSLVLAFLAEYAHTLLTAWLGQRVMFDLRGEIFAHLQRLSLRYFDRNPVGRLMTRVTNDVEQLNEAFSSGLVTIFGDVFTLLFILGMMLQLDWRLALVTFTVLPLRRRRHLPVPRPHPPRLSATSACGWRASTRSRRSTSAASASCSCSGARTPVFARFKQVNADHLEAHLRSITYYALFFPVIEVLTAVALALILWYGGGETLQGTMTVGVVAAFLQYTRRFFRPIQDLSEKYNILQGAMAASERIFAAAGHGAGGAGRSRSRCTCPRPAAGRSSSATSGSATATTTSGCSRGSASPRGRGSGWRSWAPRGRGRAPSSRC